MLLPMLENRFSMKTLIKPLAVGQHNILLYFLMAFIRVVLVSYYVDIF